MRVIGATTLCLALVAVSSAADPSVRLPVAPIVPQPMPPAPPVPGGVVTLNAEELYVVEADTELAILCHPKGLIKFEKADPGTFYGRFAGGGKWEKRVLKGPHVYVGTAAGEGRAELNFVPIGLKSEKDIVTATVDVRGNQGPQPPPKPPEPPKPEPAKNVAWVVLVEETDARTLEFAALVNDIAYWKALEAKGVKSRFYDQDSPDVKAKKYARAGGVPYLLLLDANGRDARDGGEPKAIRPAKWDRSTLDALLGGK